MAESTQIFDGPDGIELYRLASIKARIRLESQGLKVGRGKSTRALVAAELGLNATDKHDLFIIRLNYRILALKKKILRERMVVEERGTDWMVMCCDRSSLVMQNLNRVDRDAYFVFFYKAGVQGDAVPKIETFDLAQAMDLAEAWVTEIRE